MNENIKKIIVEEITRVEISNMIASDRAATLNSKEFKDKVKDISAKVIEELYKILWTRKNFWADSIKK